MTATTWHREAFAAVERWPWLHTLNDRVTAAVQPVYDRFRANPALELMHGGRWMGHALHPALSDLPIGFPSATLSAAGLVAAAATATTGVVDWSVSDDADRRVGLFHGLLNAAAMTIQGASLTARLTGHRRTGRALGATSLAVTAAAGFVGGHLVQGRAVMVNRVATTTGPTRWVPALPEAELPDGAVTGVTVEGRQVLLARDGDEVHAIDDLCSHAGALLSRGEVADCRVTCPLHFSVFDLRDGRIVRGPAHHPQPVLPTRIRKGQIEVRGSLPRGRRAKN